MPEWEEGYHRISEIENDDCFVRQHEGRAEDRRPDRKTWPEHRGMTSATDS